MIIDLLLNFSSVAFHVMRQRTDAFKSVREMEHYSTYKRKFWHLLWHGLILKMSYSVKYASHKGTETVWSQLDEELEQTNSQRQKAKWGVSRVWEGRNWGLHRCSIKILRHEDILNMDGGDSCLTMCMYLMPLNCTQNA